MSSMSSPPTIPGTREPVIPAFVSSPTLVQLSINPVLQRAQVEIGITDQITTTFDAKLPTPGAYQTETTAKQSDGSLGLRYYLNAPSYKGAPNQHTGSYLSLRVSDRNVGAVATAKMPALTLNAAGLSLNVMLSGGITTPHSNLYTPLNFRQYGMVYGLGFEFGARPMQSLPASRNLLQSCKLPTYTPRTFTA